MILLDWPLKLLLATGWFHQCAKLTCAALIYLYIYCIFMAIHTHKGLLVEGIVSSPDATMSEESTQAALLYPTCCWLEVLRWWSQTDRRQAEEHTWVYTHTHTRMCTHKENTPICTFIYRYLHWTSNFWSLWIQSALFSHFEVLCSCTVQIFLCSSTFFHFV